METHLHATTSTSLEAGSLNQENKHYLMIARSADKEPQHLRDLDRSATHSRKATLSYRTEQDPVPKTKHKTK